MTRINPEFTQTLKKLGAENVTVCFNCGNCTAICPLSSNEHMFPRRIIRYIQLGLESKAVTAPEPWICHGCGDCSATCPRQAFPSEIMNAVRTYAFYKYATPRFMGKLFESPKYLPILIAIPVILMAIFLKAIGAQFYPPGPVDFSKFIPHEYVEYVGIALGIYVGIVTLASAWRFWKALGLKSRGFISDLVGAIVQILKHSRFKECGVNTFRYYAHMLMFYGFIIIGISTLGALAYLNIYGRLSLPLTNPIKIVGNFGAILLLIGVIWVIGKRLGERNKIGAPNYNDWFFMITLLIVGITGVLTEGARLLNIANIAYPMYLIHLIAVFCLLIYAPYSKFAHLLYRGLVYVYLEAERKQAT